MDEVLAGGLDNSGKLLKRGNSVIRKAGPHSASVHRFLRHVEKNGFAGAPRPEKIEDGQEEVSFVAGLVPEPPYSEWYFSEDVLICLGQLIRKFHDAAKSFEISQDSSWNTDLADPCGRGIICHNDIAAGNVVFDDKKPVGIIDFDHAAPGRPLWDLARACRNWIPLDDPASAETYGMSGLDSFARLRVFIESYDLTRSEKTELPDLIEQANLKTESFVRSQMQAGRPAFVRIWNELNLERMYEKDDSGLIRTGRRLSKH